MKRTVLISLALALMPMGCSLRSLYSGDFFYLSSGGQYMPAWVKGNTSSRLFVIVLHGGPGGSALDFREVFTPMQDLEARYAFVYWDQPCSGSTQSSDLESPFSVDLAVSATEQLVSLIKARYGDPKIVLFGHSWGGTLGTAYLLDPGRQAGIEGWIEMDGGHNYPLADALSRQFVVDYATAKAQGGSTKEREQWTSILNWYDVNPVINASNCLEHLQNVKLAHGYNPVGASFGRVDYLGLLMGPYDLSSLSLNNVQTVTSFLSTLISIDYSQAMSAITLPTLLLWGAKDGLIPAPLAQDAYDHLGTPASQKSIVGFPNSGHSPTSADFPLLKSALEQFLSSL